MGHCLSKQSAPANQRPTVNQNRPESDSDNEVEPRFVTSTETKSITLGGLKIRYGYISQRGYYPDDQMKANQDSYSITTNFTKNRNDALFAVYDGHGRYGDKCAQFSRDHLPNLIARHVKRIRNEKSKKRNSNTPPEDIVLRKEAIQSACATAHKQCNLAMHASQSLDDALSGTTAISCYVHGQRNRITVCNVGDSRAVLGQRIVRKSDGDGIDGETNNGIISATANANGSTNNGSNIGGEVYYKALPLSRDQTPYRRDERKRIRAHGGRILSLDQIEGLEPVSPEENDDDDSKDDIDLGKEIDEGGDPPRVWHPEQDYPGTAFTRSLGDALAEELGVYAEPEMLTRQLEAEDEIIVLASDGVFEFLTNQSVIDICAKFKDPLSACRAVVAESYELWLQYELRTDDITMICIFIDSKDNNKTNTVSRSVAINNETADDKPDMVAIRGEARPVRSRPTVQKSELIRKLSTRDLDGTLVEDDFDISELFTEKSEEDKACISQAIKTTVMLQGMAEAQREMIFGVIEPVKVEKGTWVIREGEVGDKFYIVEEGEFEVRIIQDGQDEKVKNNGGKIVHVYHGSKKKHIHPSFGELALLYSIPRAASVVARTNGKLWALHKRALRKVLVEQSGRQELLKVLRTVSVLKDLSDEEIEFIAGTMELETFGTGHNITVNGTLGNTLYVISQGSSDIIIDSTIPGAGKIVKKLTPGSYFGHEALESKSSRYLGTVTTLVKTTCWKINRNQIKSFLKKFDTVKSG
mmetsp:Transcript_2234/g.2529  ORF Transcript_2234/g.2529 Transcript_2234/m.2529 type:complete len:755 (-) Transcript_2234:120-2384(-)